MTGEVCRWIEQEGLIQPGDHVLAGVSGGADSVAMFCVLCSLRERLGFTLTAVHVEHGIRGEESRSDAAFVQELCAREGVPCQVYHVDAPGCALERGIGLEEAARSLRYACYRKEAERSGAARVKVALAHHANDRAETVLFQMARGSGIRGMCGIPVQRRIADDVQVIRPMLAVTREEIEAYLEARGQAFRSDRTNDDLTYSRNRIRHAALPQLTAVNARAVQHICQEADQLSLLCDYLDGEIERIAPQVCVQDVEDGSWLLRGELFARYHPALVQGTVHRVIARVAGSGRDITCRHVEDVTRLAERQVGRRLSLPGGILAERVYEGVRLSHPKERGSEALSAVVIGEEQLRLAEQGLWVEIPVPDGRFCLRVRKFSGETEQIPQKTYTKWLNYDKIKNGLCLRKRSAGDYLAIDGQGHTKKLREYLIEEKIPAARRGELWLLAEGSHVLWVEGGRISADYRVEADTGRVLEIQRIGGSFEDQED